MGIDNWRRPSPGERRRAILVDTTGYLESDVWFRGKIRRSGTPIDVSRNSRKTTFATSLAANADLAG